jgi:hypothetical protein
MSARRRGNGYRGLRYDFGSERLRYDFSVPHNKRVGSHFVRIVRRFRTPKNVGVVTLNVSLLYHKRGSRFCKLQNESFEKRSYRLGIC